MVDRLRSRSSVRGAAVWRSVSAVLAELVETFNRTELDVLDAGGGTGGFAVPLAARGHRVTVVDSSPDSLAALQRRAVDAGVHEHVRGVQGDAANLLDVAPPSSFDLVVCHSVLEMVDDPGDAVAGIGRVLRPSGVVSVLAANRIAAVIHRAVAGRFDEALHALHDPLGRYSAHDPAPRRFSLHDLTEILAAGGLEPLSVQGSRVFADLVPSGLLDGDAEATEALIALELAAADHPAFREMATQLHVLARRPAG